jgi:uncharacterized protein
VNFLAVQHYVELQLQKLGPELTYHNADHTLADVLPAALRLGKASNLGDEEMCLLATAVLFHDLGYLEKYHHNEPIGADCARQILPGHNYSQAQIDTVVSLILATSMPQKPVNHLEAIICDADLDSLWRDDFMVTSENLLKELNHHGAGMPLSDWLTQQQTFLSKHKYHCEVDLSSRNAGKLRNIERLRCRISRRALS